jgi:hypothetical protein
MKCALCQISIHPTTAWQVTSDLFYCSEFCAEAAEDEVVVTPSYRKAEIDRQYLQRLERLLPYLKNAQGIPAASRV